MIRHESYFVSFLFFFLGNSIVGNGKIQTLDVCIKNTKKCQLVKTLYILPIVIGHVFDFFFFFFLNLVIFIIREKNT